MKQEELIKKILSEEVFRQSPPVLADIGASGQIHPEWETLAAHSVCIAFDADSRDFQEEASGSRYLKLHLINAIVSDKDDKEVEFYLTRSPHCSSSLMPRREELERWSFAPLFEVEKKVQLKNVEFVQILRERNIAHIDWFKTDSQGIDLRLFRSLPEDLQRRVLVAEFEPGFINAYANEDRISGLLPYMERLPFWLSDCSVKGSQRIAASTVRKYGLAGSSISLRDSACWAEFSYINTCESIGSLRDLLLCIAFSVIKRQYGFALDLLTKLDGKISGALQRDIETFLLAELKPETPGPQGLLGRIRKAIR